MKPSTAAQKLGILLSAAPESFKRASISRVELDALPGDAPAWLTELRKNGPFPRDVIAQKLGVSKSGLIRGGITEPLNSDEIGELIANPPEWLIHERAVHREVVAEAARQKEARKAQAAGED